MNNFCNSLLEAAIYIPSSLQSPSAWCGHLPFASWIIKQIHPKIFVELGTHSGNSYFAFCESANKSKLLSRCYAVDTWKGDDHAGQYGETVFDYVNGYNQANYANFSSLLRMTFDEASSYFADASIELLHIDGLHTYDAVKHDFETWLPKLAPGAVVLFHDTNVREREFGVWKYWAEIQVQYPRNIEFFHSHGLGVIQIHGSTNTERFAWLENESAVQETLKEYFSALGARQVERFEQIQYRLVTLDLQSRLDSEKANATEQILYRDALITDLQNKLKAEKENATEQILYRDELVTNLQSNIVSLERLVGSRKALLGQFIASLWKRKA